MTYCCAAWGKAATALVGDLWHFAHLSLGLKARSIPNRVTGLLTEEKLPTVSALGRKRQVEGNGLDVSPLTCRVKAVCQIRASKSLTGSDELNVRIWAERQRFDG